MYVDFERISCGLRESDTYIFHPDNAIYGDDLQIVIEPGSRDHFTLKKEPLFQDQFC